MNGLYFKGIASRWTPAERLQQVVALRRCEGSIINGFFDPGVRIGLWSFKETLIGF